MSVCVAIVLPYAALSSNIGVAYVGPSYWVLNLTIHMYQHAMDAILTSQLIAFDKR